MTKYQFVCYNSHANFENQIDILPIEFVFINADMQQLYRYTDQIRKDKFTRQDITISSLFPTYGGLPHWKNREAEKKRVIALTYAF